WLMSLQSGGNNGPYWPQTLVDHYGFDWQSFICPGQDIPKSEYNNYPSMPPVEYGMNSWIAGGPSFYWPNREQRYKHYHLYQFIAPLSTVPYLMDMQPGTLSLSWMQDVSWPHSGSTNVLYLDGHVESVKRGTSITSYADLGA